ncbi:hypothetical protein ART_2015 [Arthrobacter sp. PAMC 25486]|nr:hypothetical protein ART_2015 [Arthrobacter sp. PAMC 25486]
MTGPSNVPATKTAGTCLSAGGYEGLGFGEKRTKPLMTFWL